MGVIARGCLGSLGQVFLPVRLWAIHSPHEPCCAKGCSRRDVHSPAHLTRRPVAFHVVAAEAAGHQVLPTVCSSTGARDHVVDGGGVSLAIGAALVVSPKNPSSGYGNVTTVGDADIPGQDNHRRSLEGSGDPTNRSFRIGLHNRCSTVHHQHQGPPKRHHREGFVAGIQHQGARRPAMRSQLVFVKKLRHRFHPHGTTKKGTVCNRRCPRLAGLGHPTTGGWPATCIRK